MVMSKGWIVTVEGWIVIGVCWLGTSSEIALFKCSPEWERVSMMMRMKYRSTGNRCGTATLGVKVHLSRGYMVIKL